MGPTSRVGVDYKCFSAVRVRRGLPNRYIGLWRFIVVVIVVMITDKAAFMICGITALCWRSMERAVAPLIKIVLQALRTELKISQL